MKNSNVVGGRLARGGARKGAGRKPGLLSALKQLAIEKAESEAEKSLAFCVAMRDNEKASHGIQLEAARIIMERVWGKPRQAVEIGGKDGEPLKIQIVNYGGKP